jgi:hypothetical protein
MHAVRYPIRSCAAFLVCLFLLCACGEQEAPSTSKAESSAPDFVGSLACRECHETQYESWQGSHHDLAMQLANSSTVLGDFDDSEFEYFGEKRTRNADGEDEDFVVSYTYGVDPLQQYLVELENGHIQPLPFAWDSRPVEDGGQRWYHLYPDEYIGSDDALFWTRREQNWNYMCAECHSTNVELNYTLAEDRYATTWSEINVGCEACHGPASLHVAAVRNNASPEESKLQIDFNDRDGVVWQINPATGIAERDPFAMRTPAEPEACGRCHARRGLITETYEYGKPLAHTHRPALLTEPLYFSDGQIRDEVYVYGSFLQSRMYQAGVTCSDCHDPHSARLRTGASLDAACAQCHLPERFAVTAHHGHEVSEVACADCHMPSRVYMGVDGRRDHSLRVPRPDLSVGTDLPNACTSCHEDQTNEWAADAARDWWGEPGSSEPNPAGIVRATTLAELAAPLSGAAITAVERALGDPDPLVRLGALQAAANLPPERALQALPGLLEDDVRGVRIEVVSALAPLHDHIPAAYSDAFEAAADEYRAAQAATASRPVSHQALAEFESRLGNEGLALEHSDQALAMAPDNALVRHSRGLLLVRLDRHDEALDELRRAAELAPMNPRFVYVYAVALNSLGDKEGAMRVIEEASINHPEDADIAAFRDMLRPD